MFQLKTNLELIIRIYIKWTKTSKQLFFICFSEEVVIEPIQTAPG